MRLHSLIYAVDVHTPFIAIDYSDKVNGLLKDLGMTEYSIPVEELSLDLFKEKYRLLAGSREAIVSKLLVQSAEMKVREKKNKQLILQILEGE